MTDQVNPGTVYTFALGRNEKLPEFEKAPPLILADIDFEATPEEIRRKRDARLHAESIGLVGDALPSGWQESHPLHQIKGSEGVWEGQVTLEEGELKFRANNNWQNSWGGVAFPKGYLNEHSGNIRAEPGTYLVSVNLLSSEYLYTKVSE